MNKMNRKMVVITIAMIILLLFCVIKLIIIAATATPVSTVPSVTQSIHSTYRNNKIINTSKQKTQVKAKSSIKRKIK